MPFHFLSSQFPEFPARYESFAKIGNIYKSGGDFNKSREYYKKALLLEPDEYSIIDNLADIEVQSGNFDDALALYDKALNAASGRGNKADIYSSLSKYYQLRGQIDKSIENFNLRIVELRKNMPAILVNQLKPLAIELYLSVNRREEAMQAIHDFEKEVTLPNVNGFVAAFYINYYLDAGDEQSLAKAEQKLIELRAFIEKTQAGHLNLLFDILEGKIAHAKGEYQRALTCFSKTFQQKGVVEESVKHRYIAETYRELKEYDQAVEHLNQALKLEPIEPTNQYELALVYSEMDEEDKAKEHLNKALAVWDKADPAYKPAIKARELHAKVGK